MSGPSTISNESLSRSPDADGRTADDRQSRRAVGGPLQFVGFWSAVALPFLHVPLLASGLGGLEESLAFLSLLALNFVALLVGHGYNES